MGLKNILSCGYAEKAEIEKKEYENLFMEKSLIIENQDKVKKLKNELDDILLEIKLILKNADTNKISSSNDWLKNLEKNYTSFLNLSVSTSISKNKLLELSTGISSGITLSIGAWGLAGLGSASTGTAIATLSGAAATNATLAALGGGSITTGGFGMLGGIVSLSGIFAVGIIPGVITASSYKKYKTYLKGRKELQKRLKKAPSSKEFEKISLKLETKKSELIDIKRKYISSEISEEELFKNINILF